MAKFGHFTPHTEESKKKMSVSLLKKWASGTVKPRPPMSEETRIKIRNTLRKGSNRNCKL